MTLKFLGKLANGNNFMTNPTSCTKWESKVWASAHQNNSNATEDPLGTGDLYVPDSAPSITPDCTNQADIPFPVTGVTTISSRSRDVSPDFDFTITNPGVQADGQVSTSPKSVVTRVRLRSTSTPSNWAASAKSSRLPRTSARPARESARCRSRRR